MRAAGAPTSGSIASHTLATVVAVAVAFFDRNQFGAVRSEPKEWVGVGGGSVRDGCDVGKSAPTPSQSQPLS